jgi:hypothetical protein
MARLTVFVNIRQAARRTLARYRNCEVTKVRWASENKGVSLRNEVTKITPILAWQMQTSSPTESFVTSKEFKNLK